MFWVIDKVNEFSSEALAQPGGSKLILGGLIALNGRDVVIDPRWSPEHFRAQAREAT